MEVYEILKETLGEVKASKVLQLFETKSEETFNHKKDVLATKDDISNLKLVVNEDNTNLRLEVKEEISNLRSEVKEDIAKLRLEVKEEISNLRSEVKEDIAKLRVEMKDQKSEIIKWMFIFWVSQMVTTIGFLVLYLKK